jgi:hypothetical protein
MSRMSFTSFTSVRLSDCASAIRVSEKRSTGGFYAPRRLWFSDLADCRAVFGSMGNWALEALRVEHFLHFRVRRARGEAERSR